MNVTIDLDNASSSRDVPRKRQFKDWSAAALLPVVCSSPAFSLSIRLLDEAESAELNQRYRGKSGPTNVLSFPMSGGLDWPEELPLPLGDLAICVPVVEREAREQQKTPEAHWAHLTVHGVLHLQGYDHETESEAEAMEALEVHILSGLGYNNPYE